MTRVTDRSRWLIAGASGTVHTDEFLEIPEFDGGELIEVRPVQIDALWHQAPDWSWQCTSVSIVGAPVIRQDPSVSTVSHTYSDVQAALELLPEWATTFVERNTPTPP